jgi:hypothetical protein
MWLAGLHAAHLGRGALAFARRGAAPAAPAAAWSPGE